MRPSPIHHCAAHASPFCTVCMQARPRYPKHAFRLGASLHMWMPRPYAGPGRSCGAGSRPCTHMAFQHPPPPPLCSETPARCAAPPATIPAAFVSGSGHPARRRVAASVRPGLSTPPCRLVGVLIRPMPSYLKGTPRAVLAQAGSAKSTALPFPLRVPVTARHGRHAPAPFRRRRPFRPAVWQEPSRPRTFPGWQK